MVSWRRLFMVVVRAAAMRTCWTLSISRGLMTGRSSPEGPCCRAITVTTMPPARPTMTITNNNSINVKPGRCRTGGTVMRILVGIALRTQVVVPRTSENHPDAPVSSKKALSHTWRARFGELRRNEDANALSKTPPPNPLPLRGEGEKKRRRLACSPSPLRGGGWGEGFSSEQAANGSKRSWEELIRVEHLAAAVRDGGAQRRAVETAAHEPRGPIGHQDVEPFRE